MTGISRLARNDDTRETDVSYSLVYEPPGHSFPVSQRSTSMAFPKVKDQR